MPAGDPPAVARRRVRLALREARERRGLTQAEVAEQMEWSTSKVMRIETGEVTVSPNDLRPLLAYLGITDRALVDELVQSAKASRRRQEWWDQPRFREHIAPVTRRFFQYEVQATAVRHFYSAIIPGRLQTPGYADRLLRTYAPLLSAEDRETRLEARMLRRRELLSRKSPPDIFLLLDESVLLRTFGDRHVLGEQLVDLSRLIAQKRVRVRIVPFDISAPAVQFGSYEILDLGSDADAIMYVEALLEDRIIEESTEIARYREFFDQLWHAVPDEVESAHLIEQHARELLPAVKPTG